MCHMTKQMSMMRNRRQPWWGKKRLCMCWKKWPSLLNLYKKKRRQMATSHWIGRTWYGHQPWDANNVANTRSMFAMTLGLKHLRTMLKSLHIVCTLKWTQILTFIWAVGIRFHMWCTWWRTRQWGWVRSRLWRAPTHKTHNQSLERDDNYGALEGDAYVDIGVALNGGSDANAHILRC